MAAWKTSSLSPAALNRAGRTLVDQAAMSSEREAAVSIVSEWRSSHAFPLNTIQMWLRRHARSISPRALVAQRLKRLESAESKLRRFPTMNLSQIQDFGGCRAILPTLQQVEAVVNSIKKSTSDHELKNEKDYISLPAPSGYRSRHLIYRYNSTQAHLYARHFIEMQIRTQAQHDWATAVEIFGTFLRQELKSGLGEQRYLDFFRLVGELFFADESGLFRTRAREYRSKIIFAGQEMRDLRILQRMNAFSNRLRKAWRGVDEVIQAWDVDPRDAPPDGRDCQEDEALPI